MKKVLILSSSPRRGGNSDTLCEEFMRGAVDSGHAGEIKGNPALQRAYEMGKQA